MLPQLVHPLSAEEFGQSYLGAQPVTTRPTLDVYWKLLELPEVAQLERSVRIPGCSIYAWRQPGYLPRRSAVDSETALREYGEGASLYILGLDRSVPLLHRMCSRLARDLGIPRSCVTSQLFASRAGGGVSLHFDHDENLNFQLRGRKIWHISDQPHERAPLRGSFGRPGEGLPRSRAELAEAGIELRTLVVEPGMLHHVPAGFWHATECEEDSLAITFATAPPRAGELVLQALAGELFEHPDARRYAYGPVRREFVERAARAAAEFASGEGVADATGVPSVEIERTAGSIRYRWTEACRRRPTIGEPDGTWARVSWPAGGPSLFVESAWAPSLAALTELDGVWPPIGELAADLGHDPGALQGLVQSLESANTVEPVGS